MDEKITITTRFEHWFGDNIDLIGIMGLSDQGSQHQRQEESE